MPQPVQPADVHGVAESGRAATDSPPGSADDAQAARERTAGTGGAGSRAPSPVDEFGAKPHTGLGDGRPQGSSQGLAGAQGSGGAADQPALEPRRTPPA
ncbi:MAG: hypothetical protein MZW92_28590 [Comamonadaceae bacterium]|nr:hypothetical protein [Comamonadaceae bacterium]